MKPTHAISILLLGVAWGGCFSVQAATGAEIAKANHVAEKKAASQRYTEDKALCNEEDVASARMQCKRDASDVYRKALAAAQKKYDQARRESALTPAPVSVPTAPVARTGQAICQECGKVTAIHVSEKEGKGSPVGMIAGGVAGALIGNQVGGGTGRDLATIAGAAGGAYAGRKIEERMNATKQWSVSVRFDTGSERVYLFDREPGFAVGDAVKSSGDGIVRR